MKTELLTLSQEGLDSTRATVTPSESAPQVGDTVPALLAKLHTALGLLIPGSTAPTYAWENTGLVGSFRYDSANQVLYMRQPNDTDRQQFLTDFSGVLTASLFNQDVYLYDALTNVWSMNLFTTGLVDGAGSWVANTDVQDEAAAVIDTFNLGYSADTDLTAYFAGYTVTVSVAPGIWSLDVSSLADANGDALEDLNVFETGPAINSTILLGVSIASTLQTLLGANYTVGFAWGVITITQLSNMLVTEPLPPLGLGDFEGMGAVLDGTLTHTLVQDQTAEISVTVEGPIGRFPVNGSYEWVKTLDGGGSISFIETTELAIIASGSAPATALASTLGTVDGVATSALEQSSDVWAIAQGIGAPNTYVSLAGSDDVRAFVGDTAKGLIIPGAGSGLLPQWVGWAVFNIFP